MLAALPGLRCYVRRLTRDPQDAEDLLQDTVLRALRFGHRYRLGTQCEAWLRTIAWRLFATDLRSARRRYEGTEVDAEELADEDDVDSRVLAGSTLDEVRGAMRELPEPFRSAVTMRVLAGLSYHQIAELLDVRVGTVKSRVCRGRRLLRRRLRSHRET